MTAHSPAGRIKHHVKRVQTARQKLRAAQRAAAKAARQAAAAAAQQDAGQ